MWPHPVVNEEQFFLQPAGMNYLARYLPPELLPQGAPGRDQALKDLHKRAAYTNQFCVAVAMGWIFMVFVLVLFLGLALESAWAADYVCRSGRGPVARAVCYLELYPPAAALLFWCLGVMGWMIQLATSYNIGGPTWAHLLTPLVLVAAWVTLAHAGVIRAWHPAIRIIAYLAIMALGIAWVNTTGGFPY